MRTILFLLCICNLSYGQNLKTYQQVNLFASEFSVVDELEHRLQFNPGKYFHEVGGIGSMTINGEDTIIIFENNSHIYEIVNSNVQKMQSYDFEDFSCHNSDELETFIYKNDNTVENLQGTCKQVEIYFECDYKLFVDCGSSTQTVMNYVGGVFNQVKKLYANENINVVISQVKIWTAPDPYISQTSIGAVLSKFRTSLAGNFNGNLAHLLTTRSLGGGIAYVDVLCFKQFAYGVSSINLTYQNVPTYSWSVEVITHELGHNLGSWHTHSCKWPQGALDNCYTPEGGCLPGPTPVNGGTIMSYCHLTAHGINFNNGFGIVPGNHIRLKVNSASCLASNSMPPTNLKVDNVTTATAQLSWSDLLNSSPYTIRFRQKSTLNWNEISAAIQTHQLINLQPNTIYEWQVKSNCSDFSNSYEFITNPNANCGDIVNLNIFNITANSAVITWNSVSGANFYIVQLLKLGESIWKEYVSNSTTITLTDLTPNSTYQIKVKANCSISYTIPVEFKTINPSGCQPPQNFNITDIKSNRVTLSWDNQNSQYYIGIKLSSQNQFFTLGPISFYNVVISGLQPNTSYDFKIKNICSDWTQIITITTMSFNQADNSKIINLLGQTINLNDNPVSGIYFRINVAEQEVEKFYYQQH